MHMRVLGYGDQIRGPPVPHNTASPQENGDFWPGDRCEACRVRHNGLALWTCRRLASERVVRISSRQS